MRTTLGSLAGLAVAASAWAAPPTVVGLDPPNGALTVDPATTALRITFDQPMRDQSWSFLGGGPTYPETTGAPRYVDESTCELPVALEPGRVYMVGVNSLRYQGFQSRDGEPAVPLSWRFVTSGGEVTGKVHKSSVAEAVDALTLRYSHQERRNIDWGEALPDPRTPLSPAAFAVAVSDALMAAEDMHLGVSLDGASVGGWSPGVSPNLDPELLDERITDELDPVTFAGEVAGLPYLVITSWTSRNRDEQASADWLAEHCGGPVILDVRSNGGGDERVAQWLAGHYISQRVVYARQRVRSPDGTFSEMADRLLDPVGPRCKGDVAVLMGPANFSSNEAFLMMMRAAGATLVGAVSGGSSGNPRPVELSNGVVLRVPSWQAFDPQGHALEGVGLAPDIVVAWTGSGDPVVDAAVTHLVPVPVEEGTEP